MLHYESLHEHDYLGHWDLMSNGMTEVTVTIKKITPGVGLYSKFTGQIEKKPVLEFEGRRKPFVLNHVNKVAIRKLHGPDAAAWIGKQVTLYVAPYKGEHCLRVRE